MSKHIFGWILALAAMTLLPGCETMSPQECQTANWNDVGMRDGLNGQRMSMLDDRVKDCAKVGAQVDTRAYVNGRERGLQSFCRLENAVPMGLNGTSYNGVCPGHIDLEFRRRHGIAYAVYALRSQISDLDGRSRRLERKLHEADKDEDKQLKASEKEDDRKRIRNQFDDKRRQLRRELGDSDRAMRNVRQDLRAAEYSLDSLR